MLFVIHALDASDRYRRRNELYGAHQDFLGAAAQRGIKLLLGGPLTTEDPLIGVGSLYVIEARDRATAQAFCDDNPYNRNGVWESVRLHPFVKRHGWSGGS